MRGVLFIFREKTGLLSVRREEARLRKMQYPLLWERIQGEGQRNYGFFRSEAAAQASHSFDEAHHGALPRTSGKTNCSQTAPFSKRKKLSCRSFSTAAL